MAKTYELAPLSVETRAQRLIEKYHRDLANAEVTIEYVFARNSTGYAVMHGGYRALAVCRIVNLKDRSKGMKDAEITIDQLVYENMSSQQQDALLDHELEHLIVVRDDQNAIKTDDLNRPVLKMKKHDYQFGWFTNIAERHGKNSCEVVQAKLMWDEAGQAFFPMLTEAA